MKPRVSFIVPCYNYGQFVRQAIDSLLVQTFTDLEVIVINDKSTDNSKQVIDRYTSDPRVLLIHHEMNRGNIETYNEGITLARGEFIGLLSADDMCTQRDAVSKQVAMFDANPSVGFVHSAYEILDENGVRLWTCRLSDTNLVRDGLEEFTSLCQVNRISASGTLVRRRCHQELGNYDPDLHVAADWDLWLRLATHYHVGYLTESLYGYRIHANQMSHSRVTPRQATREHVLTIRRAFDRLPSTAPAELQRLRSAAIRHAFLLSAQNERAAGRIRRSWVGLLDAIRQSPGLVVWPGFLKTLGGLALETALGHGIYSALVNSRRERRANQVAVQGSAGSPLY